jgi:CHAD domain-containing protein
LRSGLQAFAPLVDQEWAKEVRAELGWVAGAMGAARDREVLEGRLVAGLRALSPSIDRAAGLVVVQDTLDAERLAAAAFGREALMSPRYLRLLDTLIAAAAQPPTTRRAKRPASQVLPALVNARWATLERAARRLADELEGHDDHWHRTRIDAKKARYTVEAVTPVFGAPAKAFAQQLARVTDLLGRHQDCAIAADTVAAMLGRDTGPRAAFALGALYEQQRAELRGVRREFLALWPEIAQPRWRRWLRAQR